MPWPAQRRSIQGQIFILQMLTPQQERRLQLLEDSQKVVTSPFSQLNPTEMSSYLGCSKFSCRNNQHAHRVTRAVAKWVATALVDSITSNCFAGSVSKIRIAIVLLRARKR